MVRREVVEPVTAGTREIKAALTLDPEEIAPGLGELRETLESNPLDPRGKRGATTKTKPATGSTRATRTTRAK